MTLSAMPIATPPARAIGIDAMPPMSAAASTRSNIPGPTPSAEEPAGLSGPNSIAAVAASAPETTQTIVDIRLMLMPDSRAASAFAAEARIASPYFVRFMKSVSAITSTGMTTITVSSWPRTRTPPMSHEPEKAVGYGRTRVTSGRISWKKSSTCAAPISATSRMTRGAENSRRTMSSSSAAPTIAPTAMPVTNEIQNGTFQSMTSR